MKRFLILFSIVFCLFLSANVQAETMTKRANFDYSQWSGMLGRNDGFYFGVGLIVNFDSKINFFTEDDYSITSGLCNGQKFKLDIEDNGGEWVGEGGWYDSPPIEWVSYNTDKHIDFDRVENSYIFSSTGNINGDIYGSVNPIRSNAKQRMSCSLVMPRVGS